MTSLIIGGVGVANAIRGYVERKRTTIAILKSLGATGSKVFALMLTQMLLVACLGVVIGALIGAALPFVAAWGFGAMIPFPLTPSIHASAIGQGVLYGFLTALAFSIAPLGGAHDAPVQAVFRAEIEPRQRGRGFAISSSTLAAGAGPHRRRVRLHRRPRARLDLSGRDARRFRIAARHRGADHGGRAPLAAGRAASPCGSRWRISIAPARSPHRSYYRWASASPFWSTLTLIDGNIRAELKSGLPGATPSFFFLDVQNAKADAFAEFLHADAPDGKIDFAPMLRGRIVMLNGIRADAAEPKPSVAWVLQGDRGITFAASLPEGSAIVKGAWWSKDYKGPPLISLESDVADGLGLALGDEITVNVLGRDITGRIANLRKVNWRGFGINFVLVFSQNSFAGAPYADLATLTFPDGGESGRELALLRDAARIFPAVTTIRVKDALEAASRLVAQLAIAVRGASSVALMASILVLGGALAAGRQARTHEAVVLKTLGATRPRLLAAFVYEYGLIGFCTALFGMAAGGAAAFAIVRNVMKLDFVWLWPEALGAAVCALALTIVLGFIGAWRILGRKPGPYLRDL